MFIPTQKATELNPQYVFQSTGHHFPVDGD